MSVFDEMMKQYGEFMNECESMFPGFKTKVSERMHEKENNDLLAEDAKLADELDALTKKREELDKQIEDINARRLEIHKTWTKLNPVYSPDTTVFESPNATNVESPNGSKRPDIKTAFNVLYQNIKGANYLGKPILQNNYKRFDNLIHARCTTTSIFGKVWNIDNVTNFIAYNGYEDLAGEIYSFWNNCNSVRNA